MSFNNHVFKGSGMPLPQEPKAEKMPFNVMAATGHAGDVSEEDFFLAPTWQHKSKSYAENMAYLEAKEKKNRARKEKSKRENNGYSDWDDERYDEAGDSEDIDLDIIEAEGKVVDDNPTPAEQSTKPAGFPIGVVSAALPVAQPSPEQAAAFPFAVEDVPTSIELAERVVDEHAFVNYQGKVHMFEENVYKHMSITALKHFCYGKFYKEIRIKGKPNFAKEIADALENLVLSRPPIVKPKINPYLVLRNCRLNLETFEYEPNGPDYFETVCVQVDYDPYATECPHFDRYLHSISQGNERVEELCMEVMAYSIAPGCPVKKLFLAYGEKDCGKSVMINFTSSFLPDEAVSTITMHELAQKFKSGSLMDARLNVDADLPDKVIPDAEISTLKKLTGVLDKMEGEKKYEQGKAFHPECKLLFASNHFLRMRKIDEAFLSRLIVIPFCYSVPKEEQDEHLIEHLYDERSAIFNKIIKRYRRLAENHFRFSICVEPEKYCKATANNADRTALFAFSKFISETLEVTGNDKDFVATQELADLFDIFSEKNGCTELRRNFPALLSSYIKENYADSVRSVRRGANNARGYCGVRLVSSDR